MTSAFFRRAPVYFLNLFGSFLFRLALISLSQIQNLVFQIISKISNSNFSQTRSNICCLTNFLFQIWDDECRAQSSVGKSVSSVMAFCCERNCVRVFVESLQLLTSFNFIFLQGTKIQLIFYFNFYFSQTRSTNSNQILSSAQQNNHIRLVFEMPS